MACQDQKIAQVLAACLAMILISLVVTSDPVSVDACTRVCRSSVPHDANGDGLAEVAVGEPANHTEAGAIHFFYGYRCFS